MAAALQAVAGRSVLVCRQRETAFRAMKPRNLTLRRRESEEPKLKLTSIPSVW